MAKIFLGCLVYPDLQIRMCPLEDTKDQAQALEIIVGPGFVLNGKVVAVSVPRKEWLIGKLRESGLQQTTRVIREPES